MLGEVFIFSMIIWQLCEITYHNTSRVSLPHRSMELCVMSPRNRRYRRRRAARTGDSPGAAMAARMLLLALAK
jgi:hypothetical protein